MKKIFTKEKKYFVSLCLKVPANFEVEVEAKNEKIAFKKAYNMFDGGNWESISDPFWEETKLDLGGRGGFNSPGVHIEEI